MASPTPQRLGPRPVAPHLRDLPVDDRGYPVPAEAPWDLQEQPYLSKVDPVLQVLLAAHRACIVCGYPIPAGESVWRTQDEWSRRNTHEDTRDGEATHLQAPGHLICMLYSALVCPFWATPGSRLSRDSAYTPGGRRGDAPSIMGYRDYALVIEPVMTPGQDPLYAFIYAGYVEEVVFNDPHDLEPAYQQLRQQIGGSYATRKRRHYAPAFGGRPRLRKDFSEAFGELQRLGPSQVITYDGRRSWLRQAGWMT